MEVALFIFSGSLVGMIIMIILRSFYPMPVVQQSFWYKIDVFMILKKIQNEFHKKTRPIFQLILSYIFIGGRYLRIATTRVYMKIHSIIIRHLDNRPNDRSDQ